jgi:CubicO group peptidase (beta-lactamase class C family)
MQKTQRIICLLVIILLAGCLTESCSASLKSQPAPEYWPTQNWQSRTPEAQGMDSERLAQMFETIQKDDIPLHSLLIVRNGYLVTEAYWPPYGPGDVHSIESNTKSIIAALVGIAIEQGKFQSVDQKLVDFFPERTIQNLNDGKQAITLRDLLSMTPGLSCQDLSSGGQGMYQADDWIQYLLDLPVSDPPGSRWIYCSGAAHLLSAILQKTTGLDARSYANASLFKPLGIPDVPQEDWNTDPSGVTNGIAGLYLAPRDLAKFGYLYLKKGMWDGQQVVPARWVEESTQEQAYIGPDDYVNGLDRRFGYMWSIFPDLKYYGYLGMAGQELYVLPEKEMVIVFTGSLPAGKEAALLDLINEYIVPAASSNEPLPANTVALAKLESLIQPAAGSPQPAPALPQNALDISDKTYVLDTNPLGWKDMTFRFQSDGETAVLKMSGSPDLVIGLDDRYRLTEIPGSRPIGLRGHWLGTNEFQLDYIILGEFIESVGRFTFEEDEIKLSIQKLNFGGPPLVIHGRVSP